MEKTPSLKSLQTREAKQKILLAALRLFNEFGSDSVTTHDIAQAAQISPGNLYYHYTNKQAIIREIFYQIDVFSIIHWWQKNPLHREVRFSDFMQFYFGSVKKYRFFFHEFSSLITQDKTLAREWHTTYERLFTVMREALQGWIKQGLIRPFKSQEDADLFIETIWIIATYSHVHFEARYGKSAQIKNKFEKCMANFLYPYHTKKGQRVIELFL